MQHRSGQHEAERHIHLYVPERGIDARTDPSAVVGWCSCTAIRGPQATKHACRAARHRKSRQCKDWVANRKPGSEKGTGGAKRRQVEALQVKAGGTRHARARGARCRVVGSGCGQRDVLAAPLPLCSSCSCACRGSVKRCQALELQHGACMAERTARRWGEVGCGGGAWRGGGVGVAWCGLGWWLRGGRPLCTADPAAAAGNTAAAGRSPQPGRRRRVLARPAPSLPPTPGAAAAHLLSRAPCMRIRRQTPRPPPAAAARGPAAGSGPGPRGRRGSAGTRRGGGGGAQAWQGCAGAASRAEGGGVRRAAAAPVHLDAVDLAFEADGHHGRRGQRGRVGGQQCLLPVLQLVPAEPVGAAGGGDWSAVGRAACQGPQGPARVHTSPRRTRPATAGSTAGSRVAARLTGRCALHCRGQGRGAGPGGGGVSCRRHRFCHRPGAPGGARSASRSPGKRPGRARLRVRSPSAGALQLPAGQAGGVHQPRAGAGPPQPSTAFKAYPAGLLVCLLLRPPGRRGVWRGVVFWKLALAAGLMAGCRATAAGHGHGLEFQGREARPGRQGFD